jgi:hypothetical protein
MSFAKDIFVAVLPELVSQVGQGIREWMTERRERDKCEHGIPDGRLCSKCYARRSEETES